MCLFQNPHICPSPSLHGRSFARENLASVLSCLGAAGWEKQWALGTRMVLGVMLRYVTVYWPFAHLPFKIFLFVHGQRHFNSEEENKRINLSRKSYWSFILRMEISSFSNEEKITRCDYTRLLYVCVVGAIGKISAFRPQGPRYDSRLCRDSNICVTFCA